MLARLNNRTAHFSQIWLVLAAIASLIGSTLLMNWRQEPWPDVHILPSPRASSNLPLSFEPNAGQSDPNVHFLAHAPGGILFFTNSGVELAMSSASSKQTTLGQTDVTQPVLDKMDATAVQLQFVGTNTAPNIVGGQLLPGKTNYIKGNDRSKWHTNLPTYNGILYLGLYAGIDLKYEGMGGQLKGTYTLAPGADPSAIRWRYAGAESMSIDVEGNLQIALAMSNGQFTTLTERAPVAWQDIDGRQVAVSASYVDRGDGTYGFRVGNYDPSRPLIVDPTLAYSTYLGGFYGDGASDIAVDSAGNMYITGGTNSSDFPLSDPFQPSWGGQSDAFVSKISADGQTLIYSTFLGGGGEIDGGDVGQSISVDAQGNATVGGSTDAEDFPTTPDAYQIVYAGSGDLFMSRLNADGSDLIFSTYYGDGGVESGGDFATDSVGNVYFTGFFNGGFSSYALVGEISADGSNLVFVRGLGGQIPGPGDENANTHGRGIVVDDQGVIHVTGDTRAADFPITPGAYRTTLQAYEDGFVAKLAPGGQQILAATFIPGGVSEYPMALALDPSGNVYVTGWTSSSDFVTTPGAFDTDPGYPDDSYVFKLNPTLSTLIYSSFVAGASFDEKGSEIGYGITVDVRGSAYVVGYTTSPDFPIYNAIQPQLHGPADGFITKFTPDGSNVEYSTYLGGNGGEVVGALALDMVGNAYVAGGTDSSDFPVVDPLQTAAHGGGDAFVARIFDPNGIISPTPTKTGTPSTATATPSPTACTPSPNYSFRRYDDVQLVPGTTDIGNNCDDCMTTINLPFPINFYGQTFSTANVSSNGNIQLVSNNPTPFDLDTCEVGYPNYNYMIMPYFSDMDTTDGGIFTSISGTAPNRIFNIEWRGCVFDPIKFECNDSVDFEVRLYESSPTEQIDFIYQLVDFYGGIPASVAVQKDTGSQYRQFSCLQSELYTGLLVTFFRNSCAATNTPVGTRTPTSTRTTTPTPDACHNLLPWRNEPHTILPRSLAAGAVVDNKFYVIGGAVATPSPNPNAVESFDPATNQWTPRAPAPYSLVFKGAATVGTTIYVVGYTYQPGESFIMAYDTVANTWTRRANLPENLLSGGIAAYGGKVYTFGGQEPVQVPVPHTYEYDPVTNTVIRKADMPHWQAEIGAATLGSKIYVVGGFQYIHYAYEPATDTWTTIASPLTPSFSHPGVFSMNGELWVIAGYDNPTRRGYPPGQEVQIYNPTTNRWRFGPAFNIPRYYSTAVGVINGRAYVAGGVDLNYDPSTGHELTSVESITYLECSTGTPTATPPTITTTPSITTTPVISTRTSTPSLSATPTHAQTACPIQFTDVPEGSTFYTYVRCLACRGIINGYTSGCETGNPCFKPGNNVTRGQLSKIVSNSAGLQEPAGAQQFEDVLPGSTFYDFIWRLADRGYVNGYPCGGPGEPCGGGNLPYFRPNANITRGQISKIVSNAAEFVEPAGARQFEDVLPGSTFYDFIWRLADRSIMSGYPCGGPGEPCGGGNLPYFRPGANATRGQASKIVANTFFPNCFTPQR